MASSGGPIIGALPPPTGRTPNFREPHSILPAIRGMNYFLICSVSITTVIYIYTRYFVIKMSSGRVDTAVLAYLCYITYFALGAHAQKFGAGRHRWDVPGSKITTFGYWIFVCEIFSAVCMASVRLTLSLQFKRIFVVARDGRYWLVMGFIGINIVFRVSMLFFPLFRCTPVAKSWRPDLPGSCADPGEFFNIVTACFNFAGDILVLAFPLYYVWNLQFSIRRRIAIGGLFMLGTTL